MIFSINHPVRFTPNMYSRLCCNTFCLPSVVMLPRSAADILASARPAPQRPAPKKPRRAAKVKPSASDKRFIQFSATAIASTSTPGSAPVPFRNFSTETGTSGPYKPPSTFKFLPASTPETYLKTRREEEDGHIADSGHCEEFDSMSALSNARFECHVNLKYILSCSSTPLEMFESDSSDQGSLDAEPPTALKSPVQRFEDVLAICAKVVSVRLTLYSTSLMTRT